MLDVLLVIIYKFTLLGLHNSGHKLLYGSLFPLNLFYPFFHVFMSLPLKPAKGAIGLSLPSESDSQTHFGGIVW